MKKDYISEREYEREKDRSEGTGFFPGTRKERKKKELSLYLCLGREGSKKSQALEGR